MALDFNVAQFALGLAFKLWLVYLDTDDSGQPLPDILPGQVRLAVLYQLVLVGIVVQYPGQRRAEAGKVGATVNGIDAVGKAENRLGEAVIVLERRLGNGAVYSPSANPCFPMTGTNLTPPLPSTRPSP